MLAATTLAFALQTGAARADEKPSSKADQAVAVFTTFFARKPGAFDAKLADFRKLFEADTTDGWRFAEWGDSYAALYEATKDKTYFLALAGLAKLALEFRDDRKGRGDELAGKPVAAWGAQDRLIHKRTAGVGPTVLILAPIARLRQFAIEDPALAKSAGVDPDELRTEISTGLATFDAVYERHERDGAATGRYVVPGSWKSVDCGAVADQFLAQWNRTSQQMCDRVTTRSGAPEPYNIQLRAALVHLLLGEPSSVERAREIAADFMLNSGFAIGPDGAASFRYTEGGRPEDVSHFNLDVEFFLEAAQSSPGMQAGGRQIDRALLLALSKAITDRAAARLAPDAIPEDVPSNEYVLTPYIDGSFVNKLGDDKVRAQVLGQRFSRIRRSCKQLSELVSVEPKIADVCSYDPKFRRALTPSGLAHLAKGYREAERAAGR